MSRHSPRSREGEVIIVGERHASDGTSQSADPQTDVDQLGVLFVREVCDENVLGRVVQGVLHRRSVPLVDLDDRPSFLDKNYQRRTYSSKAKKRRYKSKLHALNESSALSYPTIVLVDPL